MLHKNRGKKKPLAGDYLRVRSRRTHRRHLRSASQPGTAGRRGLAAGGAIDHHDRRGKLSGVSQGDPWTGTDGGVQETGGALWHEKRFWGCEVGEVETEAVSGSGW